MRDPKSFDHYILDLGGVIINIDYYRSIHAFEALGIPEFNALYNQFAQSQIFDQYETGKISSQQFINKLLDHLPAGITPNKVVSAWNAMILDVPAVRIELLLKLREEGKKLYMLSNINEIHQDRAWREWRKTSDVLPEEIYHKLYLSHIVGMRKPNTDIFQFVCKDIGIEPQEALFIDDSIQHIEGAKKIGLNALHLTEDMDITQLFS